MAKKYALLIGTDQYEDPGFAPLTVPRADVESLQSVLNDPLIGGFDQVDEVLNGALTEIMAAIGDLFGDKAKDDLLLLYFSGHGALDVSGQLHLSVAKTKSKRLSTTALSSTLIKSEMNNSRSRRQVLILDCCYAGAFSRNTARSKSAKNETVVNEATFDVKGYGREILVSSSATQRSWEGDKIIGSSDKSLFTHFLVQGLQAGEAAPEGESEITVAQLYDYVHGKVVSTSPAMTPQRWVEAQTDSIVLARNPNPVVKTTPLSEDILISLKDDRPHVREGAVRELGRLASGEDRQRAEAVFEVLQNRRALERDIYVREGIDAVLSVGIAESTKPPPFYESSTLQIGGEEGNQTEATAKQNALSRAPSVKSQSGTVFQDMLIDGSKGPEMVVIPTGKFRMGDIQGGRGKSKKPVHEVVIAKPFALGKYPLTFADYDSYCNSAGATKPGDSGWGHGDRPVINVSWNDATAYANWLSDQTGKRYRLPSEAEWEYAARGGMELEYWLGNEVDLDYANTNRGNTTPVKQFQANPFGLHDTLGNVWEWVQDTWHDNYKSAPTDGSPWVDGDTRLRVLRGGSWNNEPYGAYSTDRSWDLPEHRVNDVGFRLAQDF